ncbi:MAG: murein biosynthesis integral membrane protein MurJ [Kiritimatiellae bacterium]|nr:murein biosynthesis integral membrane protein MurJ [Kiritimatiellia bacterium]
MRKNSNALNEARDNPLPGAHRRAGTVAVAVVFSRVLGLVRELVFAAMFGAGRFLDAFLAAFQIPNLLRDLFAEGELSTEFSTTFAKVSETEGPTAAWRLANIVFSVLLLLMGTICFLGILASPLIVQITSFGFRAVPGKFELTVRLTRILFPFIIFLSLAAVVMGILNARFIFGVPASASTVFNLVSVVFGVLFAYVFDSQSDWRHPRFTERSLYGVSLGVLLGGMAQLGMQLPSLWRLGYRFRWHFEPRDAGLRHIWCLMWPSLIAGAAVQVNVLINGMFASQIDGARSWLNCAFRLMQFPIGVFGVAIATVTLPAVSIQQARKDLTGFGKTVEESLRLAFFLTLPAAAGLFAMAPDIIGMIYQHGRFTASDTVRTATALRAYAMGLAGYAALKVLVPCFYALDMPRTPLRVSLVGIGLNLALNFLLVKGFHLGHVGLATTTACVATMNFGQLVTALKRYVPLGRAGEWTWLLVRLFVASAACGLSAWGSVRIVAASMPPSLVARIVVVAAGTSVGFLAFGLTTFLMRVPECRIFFQMARRLSNRGFVREAERNP